MKKSRSVMVAALLWGGLSLAQSPPPLVTAEPESPSSASEPAAVAPAPPHSDEPRLFASLAGVAGGGSVRGLGLVGIGLAAGVGLQWNDWFSVSLQARGATLIFLNYVSLAAVVEFSPIDRLSLSAGIGGALFHNTAFLGTDRLAIHAALPFAVSFNFPGRQKNGERRGARLGLEFMLAPDLTGTWGVGAWTGVTFGSVWR